MSGHTTLSYASLFNDPLQDPRTPDIVVTPNVGVIYAGGTKKIAEHSGFAHDDRTVMMLVSDPAMTPRMVNSPVETCQIARRSWPLSVSIRRA